MYSTQCKYEKQGVTLYETKFGFDRSYLYALTFTECHFYTWAPPLQKLNCSVFDIRWVVYGTWVHWIENKHFRNWIEIWASKKSFRASALQSLNFVILFYLCLIADRTRDTMQKIQKWDKWPTPIAHQRIFWYSKALQYLGPIKMSQNKQRPNWFKYMLMKMQRWFGMCRLSWF